MNQQRAGGLFSIGVGETWALITALSYTATNILLRAAAVHIDPWLGSMLRQIPVFTLAWGAVLILRAPEVLPTSRRFLGWRFAIALVTAGSISFVIGNLFYFNALADGGLGITVSGAQAGTVLMALLLGLALLRERPRFNTWTGATILVGGLVLIGLARGAGSDAWLAGIFFAVGAGSSYAVANVLTRYVQRSRPTTFIALAGTSLGGLVPLLVIETVRGGGNPLAGADAAQVLIVLGAGCFNALALLGITQSLRHLAVGISSSIQSATVVFSFIGAVVIFGERGDPLTMAGIAAVAAGIVVANLRRSTSAPAAPVATTGDETDYSPISPSGVVNRTK
jgi:drug/metabolite transporter (DMT)-like permease